MKQSTKKQVAQLIEQQRRTNKLLKASAAQLAELRQTAAIGSQLQTTGAIEPLRAALDDVLAAQQRTNRLLELALRAGFDNEELLREL